VQLQAHTTLRLRASLSKAREETGKVKSPAPVPRPVHTTQLSYSETGRPRPTGFRFRPAGTSHRNRLGSEDGRGRWPLHCIRPRWPPWHWHWHGRTGTARVGRCSISFHPWRPRHSTATPVLCARRNRPTLSGVRTAQITRARSYYY
jgi:hypothetical protein